MNNETFYLGLRLFEWISLLGIVGGPVIAVLISLRLESLRRGRESKIMLMRMIMNTRHMPSDSNYNIAINLIPIEFNDNKNVMEAWRGYIEQVRYKPSEANKNEHEQMMLAKQTTMIYQMLHSLGFKLSETDIQTSAYASEGSIFRDGMYLESLHAQTRIAKTLEEQFAYVREAAGSNNGKKGTARRKT